MPKKQDTNNDVIEGEVIKQMLPVPTRDALIVTPAVAIDEAVEAYQAYQQLDQRILSDEDYIFNVQYQQGGYDKESTFGNREDAEVFAQKVGGRVVKRKRKSAFRKLANFFGLTLPEQEEVLGSEVITVEDGYVLKEWGKGWQGFCFMNRAFHVFRQQYTGVIIHKNSGTTYIGVGACSVDERTKGRESWKQRDHTIIGTAWTRMLSRGISDVIGLGEVSAEEVQSLEEIETEEGHVPSSGDIGRQRMAQPAPEGKFPHWGKVFEKAWDELHVNHTQVMALFPSKSQEDLLEQYGTLEKVYEAIRNKIELVEVVIKEEVAPARPFDAVNLLVWLKAKAAEFPLDFELTDGQRGRIVGVLDKLTGGADNRHALFETVWGQPSSKDRTDAEMAAMWKWMDCEKDKNTGDWIPQEMARQEAMGILGLRSAKDDIAELFPE